MALQDNALSVSEFILKAKEALKKVFPQSVLIYGVISNCKVGGNNVFLDLE